ncbi:MAG: tRNA preQ1(34) S-adenosylmethionine ribosyltransferase-isomerase QueA [Candidatus Dadabacteria bacterium]|nr:tRNA preQ1(34) S-adenosylmethionine ribosyltransferase-isomerase QueA [Candidatus Dadabacteria bacterium]
MKTSDFDYDLPEERIAVRPLPGRQDSRLLVLDRGSGSLTHRKFLDLPGLLGPGDLLVLNDTRVIPARLYGRKPSGAEIEVLLEEKAGDRTWKCIARGPKENLEVDFGRGLTGRLVKSGGDTWRIEFNDDVLSFLDSLGYMPLPPYIKRRADEGDRETYQTVYAEREGAIAAPTAGLHFTEGLLSEIERRGVGVARVTLHVGAGTFLPVKSENVEGHRIHSEWREVPPETAEMVNDARSRGGRVVAVGTTVLRSLESAAGEDGRVAPVSGRTDLFVYPGYRFRVTDALVTNFHMPRSTLLMLVSAFAGRELILKSYGAALENGYRFLSYGDAMFIT